MDNFAGNRAYHYEVANAAVKLCVSDQFSISKGKTVKALNPRQLTPGTDVRLDWSKQMKQHCTVSEFAVLGGWFPINHMVKWIFHKQPQTITSLQY